MMNLFYYILVYPIELFLEIIFSVIDRASSNPGIAIIGVSITISFLLLPLYKRADAIQTEEQIKQDQMRYWTDHIKKTFKGDERLMILQAYYSKQEYHPLYSLRSSVSLLLQIPFFIAAYHFLTHLELLNGVSFLCIPDLGKADGIIRIGESTVNLLPILMTVINCIASFIYTWKPGSVGLLRSIKDNAQLYILALVFLILLYPSPSGLVLYWTMNNAFSLVKNIAMKRESKNIVTIKTDVDRNTRKVFYSVAVLLTVLTGLLIPSALIAASPTEFVEPAAYRNPLSFVLSTFSISMGLFIIWMSVFYYLATYPAKKTMSLVLWLLCGLASIDYFLFGLDVGNITSDLAFERNPTATMEQSIICFAVLILVCTFMWGLWMKRRRSIPVLCSVIITCFMVMTAINIVKISSEVSEQNYASRGEQARVSLPLSKNGRNVIVIMLDRAISGYVPFIMTEMPELKERFDGFVYYPNAVAFGMHTNFAAPALFGGYEYTPKAMNERSDVSLKNKHDEALGVMPVIFSEEGFEVTVCDPPYAGYSEYGDLSIFDSYPDIHAYHLGNEFVNPEYYSQVEKRRRRSFFMYSMLKVSPILLQPYIYDESQYLSADRIEYLPYVFEKSYSVLSNLINITEIKENDTSTYLTIENDLTHDPCELQLPDYEPSLTVNNAGLETGYRKDMQGQILTIDPEFHYHANMKALLMLADWFDYLRENNIYDNTRIIVVSDHGRYLGDFPELIMDDGTDMEAANPLFMFKDFNSTGFTTSNKFMTNADTPILAMKDIVNEPINPFTGVPLDDKEKTAHDQYVTPSHNSNIEGNNNADATVFDTSDTPWYSVHDDIFEKLNWKVMP